MPKKIVIDLGERFKNAFGYVAKNKSSKLEKSGFAEKTGIDIADVYVNNNISFEDMRLTAKGFDLSFGFNAFSKDGGLGNLFAPPPMVSFKKQKNINRTEIDGSNAEVIERYGDRSWEINIQGIVIDMVNHQYPSAQVVTLRQLFDTNEPFEVAGQMFDDLGIKSIYMENFEAAGVQGFQDTVQFSISARSIKPVEFFLNDKN